jgi:nucleoid DNA-binding protein
MAGQKLTKSQFVAALAEKTGVTKKQASAMLDAMNSIIVKQLGKQGPGEVTIPGLLKLTVKDKPAVPEHEGVNPFTKQPTIIKAKPASKTVKARSVKALNDAV